MQPFAEVKERIRASLLDQQGARARRAEGARRSRDALGARQDARGGGQGAGAHACRRARPSRAASRRPARLAEPRGARLPAEAGRDREGGLRRSRRARSFIALAEVQPARAARAQGREGPRARATSWRRRRSPRRARRAAGAARRGREATGSRRRPRPLGLVRKETPSLVGPRPAARRPRHRRCARGGRLRAAREDALGARARTPSGYARPARAREEALRPRGVRAPEGGAALGAARSSGSGSCSSAFLIAARDRYAIERNAQAVRARARAGAVAFGRGAGTPCTSKSGRRGTW